MSKEQNIYDILVEMTGFDRIEIKKTVLCAPYGYNLSIGNRQQIWDAFLDLRYVRPELVAGKDWLKDHPET